MTKRLTRPVALWLAIAVVVLAVLIPNSPLYLPNFFVADEQLYDGQSSGYWINALNSSDALRRCQAIHALGAIGAQAGEAVPELSTILLEDPDRRTRIEASLALSKMSPASRAAVPALARALADKEPWVRMNAAHALVRLRGESRPAVPALIKALQDEGNRTNLQAFLYTIQEAVAAALGWASAGSAEAVPALMAALQAADTDGMRRATVRALGLVGAEARAAVPLLRALLDDKNSEVRQTAAESLQNIEGGPTPAQ